MGRKMMTLSMTQSSSTCDLFRLFLLPYYPEYEDDRLCFGENVTIEWTNACFCCMLNQLLYLQLVRGGACPCVNPLSF
jgi:hypothetical protein